MIRTFRLWCTALALLALAGVWSPATAGPTAEAAADPVPRVQLRKAVQLLGVMSVHGTGFERSAFGRWADADFDGCDTRAEVLRAEAVGPVQVDEGCVIASGQWYSWYDDRPVTGDPTRQLVVEHVVPLEEAWASGAYAWDADKRQAYANDLAGQATLTAVSAETHKEKAGRDPAGWLPPYEASRCAYITDWVLTKLRWGLTVDFLEAVKLTEVAQGCPNVPVTLRSR
ncbi:HNH endonuclease family protein [Streptomyces sp. N35]|uniref:HNH endonuclease family protein n=1 Tax=Streptomyces sp. N35 TaxID=2795730 RepID=UPI001F37BA3F|nr:HNH endonuclease family protein [Streptomyces sp. N35]